MPGRISEEKKKKEPELEKKVKKTERGLKKEENVDDKKLLKEAEVREKEKKVEEKIEKTEAKKAEKTAKKEVKKVEEILKTKCRIKPKHGKKYRELIKKIEKDKEYPASEAIDLAIETNPAKFDATVEAHIKISKKEKNIRGMVTLSGGLVKEKKVLAVTEKNVDEMVENIKAGKIDFDIMIAQLSLMPKLAVLAKTLGPKGLMPSPKAGTAVEDVEKAVLDLKSGKIEYRADKNNIVHLAVGKISFGTERIHQNFSVIMGVLPYKKIESIYLSTTMGPSIRVNRK